MQRVYEKTPSELNQLFTDFLNPLGLKDGVKDRLDMITAKYGLEI